MSLQIGDRAPNFVAETTAGRIDLYDYMGNGWAVLFSHPKDFTPVCTTELAALARLTDEFVRRDTVVLGLSVDPLDSHEVWLDDINTSQGVSIDYPVIADQDREVAALYGMIHANEDSTATVRSVFIIDPSKSVRVVISYPMSTGRDFNEILRVLDSLQLFARHQVATPAHWRHGDDVIIAPSVSDAEARERFPDGWKSPTPYLRIVPQPQ